MASNALLYCSFVLMSFIVSGCAVQIYAEIGDKRFSLPDPLPPLDYTFYDARCPQAEAIVRSRVYHFIKHDKRSAPALLKLLYEDCFFNGCDASVLLSASAQVHRGLNPKAFEIIDDIKANLESACPQTVSCADIIALAARDAVYKAKGPYFPIPTGRLDGHIADLTANDEMPAADWNVSMLLHKFKRKGLDAMDLIALSGGHTIGRAHCSSFWKTLCVFDDRRDKKYLLDIVEDCHDENEDEDEDDERRPLDKRTPDKFDNKYFKDLTEKKALLVSDLDLFNDARTREIVRSFSKENDAFLIQFIESAIKMSQIGVLTGFYGNGEIRINCSVPNHVLRKTSFSSKTAA